MYLPVNTCDTTVQVHSILRCGKVHYCTHTCSTHFGNTAGISVPMANPTGSPLSLHETPFLNRYIWDLYS